MSATGLLDACGFVASAGGSVDFVVNTAITGYQTPASAGAVNSTVYSYRAQSSDLSQWEDGFGAYTVSTTTLARTTVTASSTGSKVSFTAPPNVYITALSADLRNAGLLNSGTLINSVMGASSIGANGYYTLPGGLIIQWGSAGGTVTDPVTVTFPTTFPTACLSAVGVMAGTSATNTLESLAIYSFSTSSFSGRQRFAQPSAVGVAGETFRWIAIGY